MSATVLAVDQGTSATKALVVDESGSVLARGRAKVEVSLPRPGWVEQDPEQLWQSVVLAAGQCLEQVGRTPDALAVSNQRESALIWRRSDGAPMGPVIGWQDARTASECEALRADGADQLVRERAGLTIDPMFSATKIRWLLDQAPGGWAAAERGELCAGTVDAWLVYKLTGGAEFACEAGNASRTLLMDLHSLEWDAELLELFGVPAAALPQIRRSDAGYGVTVAAGALPAGVPVAAVLADSHAALFGHGCFTPGTGKATYGTGTSVMTPVSELLPDPDGVSQTLAWLTDTPVWALEGNIVATGGALDWLGAALGVGGGAEVEALAATVDDSAGAHLVPAFAGLGAPYWDRDASALISVNLGTRAPHLARAAIDAIAHQVRDVLDAVEDAGGPRLDVLFADGGPSGSEIVMQTQADIAGRPVMAATTTEMSALGAAHMAGLAIGIWPDTVALGALERPSRSYRPQVEEAERRLRRAGWHEAVARARGQASADGEEVKT